MRLSAVAAVLMTFVLVAGCGGGEDPSSQSDRANAEAPQLESVPSSASSTTTQRASATTSAASTSTGVPIIRKGTQSLRLADAQETDSWVEGSYEVPKVPEPVQALATNVGCYSDRELEFRFSLESGTLNIAVAQSQDSKSSSAILQFSLLADGRSVDVKKVSFDQQALLTTQLDGVSVVLVRVEQVDSSGNCGTTTALLTSVEIV